MLAVILAPLPWLASASAQDGADCGGGNIYFKAFLPAGTRDFTFGTMN